jgi:hypothetical protein
MQSQWESIIETALNTASGFAISWLMTTWVLPLYGFQVSTGQGFQITVIFTIVSVLRSYFWRRTFNKVVMARHRPGLCRSAP